MAEMMEEGNFDIKLSNNFQKLSRENLSDRVVQQIKEKIESGELKPGDKLPSDQELAAKFGISRMTLREGLKILQYTNVLAAIPGGGYEVQEPGLANLISSLSEIYNENMAEQTFRELKELRLTLEVKAVQLACVRRSEEDLIRLKQSIEKMEQAINEKNADAIIESSIEFHNIIANASGNELFAVVLDSIQDITRKGRIETLTIRGRYTLAVEEHHKLYMAIEQRDIELAVRLMQYHIETSYKDLRRDGCDGIKNDKQKSIK